MPLALILSVCVCVCFPPIHPGHQVRGTYTTPLNEVKTCTCKSNFTTYRAKSIPNAMQRVQLITEHNACSTCRQIIDVVHDAGQQCFMQTVRPLTAPQTLAPPASTLHGSVPPGRQDFLGLSRLADTHPPRLRVRAVIRHLSRRLRKQLIVTDAMGLTLPPDV